MLTGVTPVYACLNPESCTTVNGSSVVCAANAGGPLCAVCDTGYVPDAEALDGRCKSCPSSDMERWLGKMGVIVAIAGAFFVLALATLTRPAPKLKVDVFLRAAMMGIIVRRARKRWLRALHEKDKIAEGSKITMKLSAEYMLMVEGGKFDAALELRRVTFGVHSAATAVATTSASISSRGADAGANAGSALASVASHLESQLEHTAEQRLGQFATDSLGAPDVDGQLAGGNAGGGEDGGDGLALPGGDGDDGGGEGGGEGFALPEFLGEGGDEVTNGVTSAREEASNTVAFVRGEGEAFVGSAIESVKEDGGGFVKNVLAFVIPFIGQVQGVISTSQLKILMGNLQINASLSVVFSIPWPPLHVRFINLMSIFKFDMFKFLAFASPCLHSNHFMSLAMFVAMPLVIAAVFFVTFAFVALCNCINRACCHCMQRLPCCKFTVGSAGTSALKLVIFIVLFIYPTICSKVFTTFKCDNVNGESFMVADMTVTCFAGDWLFWAGVSVGAMLLYVVGIPLGLLIALWTQQRRGALRFPTFSWSNGERLPPAALVASTAQRVDLFFRNRLAYGSLYEQYDPESWWFEFGCTMRKMVLTGALVLFGAGTTPQVVTALAVCIFWFALITNAKPFTHDADDRLAQVEGLQVLFTLLVGLVLQLQANSGATSTEEETAMGVVLVALNMIVVVCAAVQQPIFLKMVARVLACVRNCRRCCAMKQEWQPMHLAQPTDEEYSAEHIIGGATWCDASAEVPRRLHARPIALKMAGALSKTGRGRRRSGVDDCWYVDVHGAVVDEPRELVHGDGTVVWADMASGTLLKTPPIKMVVVGAFSSATHWLDWASRKLLHSEPLLLWRDAPLDANAETAVWRHTATDELVVSSPFAEFGACGQRRKITDSEKELENKPKETKGEFMVVTVNPTAALTAQQQSKTRLVGDAAGGNVVGNLDVRNPMRATRVSNAVGNVADVTRDAGVEGGEAAARDRIHAKRASRRANKAKSEGRDVEEKPDSIAVKRQGRLAQRASRRAMRDVGEEGAEAAAPDRTHVEDRHAQRASRRAMRAKSKGLDTDAAFPDTANPMARSASSRRSRRRPT